MSFFGRMILMNYVSTRNTEIKVSASQAITKGISSEGGLFVPENLPAVSIAEIENAVPDFPAPA